MLTREEAKTKKCPYTFVPHGIGKHGAFSELCQAENCPKWRDEYKNKYLWCSKTTYCNPKFIIEEEGLEDFGNINETGQYRTYDCIAKTEGIWMLKEDEDGNQEVDFNSKNPREFMLALNLKECNQCPYRYGYCGG